MQHPFRRRLVRALQLAFCLSAAPSVYAASCWEVDNSGSYKVPEASVFGSSCSLSRAAQLNGKSVTALATTRTTGHFTNNGRIWNEGLWAMQGYSGSGRLDNRGTVSVGPGGLATVRRSGNLSADGSVLLHGAWQVVAAPGLAATLDLAIGATQRVTSNQAQLLVSGAQARFVGLDRIAHNSGTLSFADGFDGFSGALAPGLVNTGTVAVLSGARLRIDGSPSAQAGWLREGHWIVDDDGNRIGTRTQLQLDSGGPITRNSATVVLRGSGATFAGLSGLQLNDGSLTVAGQAFAAASLLNTGTLTAGDGGRISIGASANVSGSTLKDGTWRVQGSGSLALGVSSFATNAATVVLSGAGARFAAFDGLSRNEGSLGVEDGAALTINRNLNNPGVLHSASGGSLTVAAGTTLTHDGVLRNSGQLRVEGRIEGRRGHIDNSGQVLVTSRGRAEFATSAQRSLDTLTGGTWRVEGAGSLVVGSGSITTNAAQVVLSGGGMFSQLDALTANTGALTITDGRSDTFAQLHNTGTLTVSAGGRVTVDSSANLRADPSGQTLSGGHWQVLGSGAERTSIFFVGQGDITTNAARITLGGPAARFEQIASLRFNTGSLSFAEGANFDAASLHNTGTLSVGLGSRVTLQASANLSVNSTGHTLTGGQWVLQGAADRPATLQVGTGRITHNAASIVLGPYASFDQINGLETNSGSLTLSNGAGGGFGGDSGVPTRQFKNTGQVTVEQGASLVVRNVHADTVKDGTLLTGHWVVDARGGAATSLKIHDDQVILNDRAAPIPILHIGPQASVVLRGAQAQFTQLNARSAAGASTFTVDGSLRVLDGHAMQLVNQHPSTSELQALVLWQNGRLTVGAGSQLQVQGAKNESNFTQSSPDSVTQVDGLLQTRGKAVFDQGVVHGNGIIATGDRLLLGHSLLTPGGLGDDRTGALVLIAGPEVQAQNATLLFDLASPSDFDTLEVRATLNWETSTLRFDLGFAPTEPSYRFDVLTYAALKGLAPALSFTGQSIAGYAPAFSCADGSCALVLSAVPEPQTWALWLAGLACIGSLTRRRRVGQ